MGKILYLSSIVMGNQETKSLYQNISEICEKNSIVNTTSFNSFSEPTFIKKLYHILNPKIDNHKLSSFKSSILLNVRSGSELTIKRKKKKEKEMEEADYFRALVLTGHEFTSEVTEIPYMIPSPDPVASTLDSVLDDSTRKTQELAVALLTLLNKADEYKDCTANFYQRISNFLEQADDTGKLGSEASIALQFATILMDPKVLLTDDKASTSVLNMFMTMKPLSLYGWSKQVLAMDRSIEYIRQALMEQIETSSMESVSKISLENAIKTLAYIGLIRGSVEDLLIVIRLIIKLNISFNLEDILRRILQLPKIVIEDLVLEINAAKYKVPFEQLYVEESNWIKKDTLNSCTTDGEHIYLLTKTNTLTSIEIRKKGNEGKIYVNNKKIDGIIGNQMLFLKHKLYCYSNGKLFKINKQTFLATESKKSFKTPVANECKVATCGDIFAAYKKKDVQTIAKTGNKVVNAEVTLHDFSSEKDPKVVSITHSIEEVKEVVLHNDVLILMGKERYEIVDLTKNEMIVKSNSSMLKEATACCNAETNELFIIHHLSESEGYSLSKFDITGLYKPRVPFIENKFKDICEVEKVSMSSMQNSQVAFLLGIGIESEEAKSGLGVDPKKVIENLLTVLAYRSIQAEKVIEIANVKEAKQIINVYKSPMAIHTTSKCLATQIALIEEYYKEFINGKDIQISLEKLCYLITIFYGHLLALKKCNIALEECINLEEIKKCTTTFQELLAFISEKNSVVNEELKQVLTQNATKCLSSMQRLLSLKCEDYLKYLQELLVSFNKTKQFDRHFDNLLNWLAVSDNLDTLVNNIVLQVPEACEVLDAYFAIEVTYFSQKIERLIKNEPDSNEANHAKLLVLFREVLEKVFLITGSKLLQKSSTTQSILLDVLPAMLQRCIKRIMLKIKETYEAYRSSLEKDMASLLSSKRLNSEYSKYWGYIKTLIDDDLSMFHCLSMIATAVIGMKLLPEQAIMTASTLLKLTDELKTFLEVLTVEKRDESKRIPKLEETLVNSKNLVSDKESITYDFPGAIEISISIDKESKFPEDKVKIVVYDVIENKQLMVIGHNSVKPNYVFKTNSIKFEIAFNCAPEEFANVKYNIKIKPIVNFA